MRQPLTSDIVRANALTEIIENRAVASAERIAYRFIQDDESTVPLTFGELHRKAQATASALRALVAKGERALILCPHGMDYVVAFYGCLYAGVVAVPAYPPRNNRNFLRLESIVKDAEPQVIITTSKTLNGMRQMAAQVFAERAAGWHWLAVDEVDESARDGWSQPAWDAGDIAFLQYTSGSTDAPKGVIVTHGNLMANEGMIHRAFGMSESSVIVSWLPLFHDMGLIGMLQAAYAGATSIHLSPASFLQHPYKWLKAVTDYEATVSGGPNFAYELCTRKISDEQIAALDLRQWKVAYNGAEPVRLRTLERFAEVFARCGFQPRSFYPCYGLAEATLLVSGGDPAEAPSVLTLDDAALEHHRVEQAGKDADKSRKLVSCGQAAAGELVVADAETLRRVPANRVGEIWVAGTHVARGYWRQEEATAETFQAYLADTGEGPFLRTGDLGFIHDGELYITGRLKDLIIIRGVNYYPQDIEHTAEQSHPLLAAGACAAFSVEHEGQERLVIVQEVSRRYSRHDLTEPLEAIREAVSATHALEVHAIQLLKPLSIPKTSSGKIQRRAARAAYLAGTLEVLVEYDREKESEKGGRANSSTGDAHQLPAVKHLLSKEPDERKRLMEAFILGAVSVTLKTPLFTLSPDKSLTSLGLDSLAVGEFKNRLEAELGISVPFDALLSADSIPELADKVLDALAQEPARASGVAIRPHAEGDDTYALSHGQEALWLFYKLSPESAAYNEFFAARITSTLETRLLQEAFARVVARQRVLNSVFFEERGNVRRRVLPQTTLAWEEFDATGWTRETLDKELDEFAHRPFKLETETPLRVALYRRGADEAVMLVVAHHIAVDLWSLLILVDEMARGYEVLRAGDAAPLPLLRHQYEDYVEWHAEFLASPNGEAQRLYWDNYLSGNLPVLELPSDRPRKAVQSFNSATAHWSLDEELSGRVKQFAERAGATLYQVLLSAFQVLLHRYSNQTDIILGSPFAGRTRPEFEELIGYFVNPLPLRADFSGNPTASEHLARVREDVLGALQHQDYPFSKLVALHQAAHDLSRSPLFQVLFTFQKQHRVVAAGGGDFILGRSGGRLTLGGLSLESYGLERRSTQFDVSLTMIEESGGLLGTFEYNLELFDAATVERMGQHLRRILSAIVENPSQRVGDIDLCTASEIHQLLNEWNSTAKSYPQDKLAHQLIEEQALKTPDAVAGVYEGNGLTYRELDERATRLAAYLNDLGVGAETLVGIFLERTPDLLVAMLGVLKSGGAFQPLATEFPRERLSYMVKNSGIETVITARRFLTQLPDDISVRVIHVDEELPVVSETATARERRKGSLDDLAYVIYTSGSTGAAKGVMVAHRSILNTCYAWRDGHSWPDADGNPTLAGTYLQTANLTFDAFLADFFRALCNGGKLVFCAKEQVLDPSALYQLMRAERVDVADLVPAVLRNLFEYLETTGQNLNFLKLIVVGSDVWFIGEYRKLRELCGAQTRILNNYGVTEASVDNLFFDGTAQDYVDEQIVPVGRPLPNVTAYVLDAHLKPTPTGVPGELCLGGASPARCYLNSLELTAQKYVLWTRPDGATERIYRTGDLARFRPDGNVEFLGRIDNQIKLNGMRIEPAEIEAVIAELDGVKSVAVLVREDEPGRPYLAAYVAGTADELPSPDELRRLLKEKLPQYMVPAAYVLLDEMPLTANGKVNRRALSAVVPTRAAASGYVGARNTTEEKLVEIWKGVLGVEQVGVHDNFFDLGGHSLLAIKIVSNVREAFNVDVSIRELFTSPTPAEFALSLSRCQEMSSAGEILRLAPGLWEGTPPLSFAQQRLWFLDQFEPDNPFYNMAAAIRLEGALDMQALEGTLAGIVRRHEPLRSAFSEINGEPVLSISPSWTDSLLLIDLSGEDEHNRESEMLRLAQSEALKPFNLERDSMLRATLYKLDARHHVLLVNMHHIASDGWSTGIILREFSALYNALQAGSEPRLPDLPVSYTDYAAWQQRWLRAAALESQVGYWKEKLGGDMPVLHLPADRPRPPVQTYRGKTITKLLSKSLSARVQTLSQREGVTPFMLLLSVFKILLHRYSGLHDIIVGTPVAGRGRPELENLIGFFVNTLALRTNLSGNPTFTEALQRVARTSIDAFANQDVPFEILVDRLVPERSLSHSPIFQVVFALENEPLKAPPLRDLTTNLIELENTTAKFDLTLFITEASEGLRASFEYNTDLFDDETILSMSGHFEHLLETLTTNPALKFSEFNLLTEGERRQLLEEWNQTSYELPRLHVHTLIEEKVREHPHLVAAVCGDEEITYEALNRRANRLAHHLIRAGVEADSLVLLLADRGIDYLVAILAVFKAGGAYVPLNPEHPVARQQKILEQTGSRFVLSSRKYAGVVSQMLGAQVESNDVTHRVLEEIETSADAGRDDEDNPPPRASLNNLANVFFTSGSTGTPKGAMIEHLGMLNHLHAKLHDLKFSPGEVVAQNASQAFDISVWQFIAPLLVGGKTVIIADEIAQDAVRLLREVDRKAVNIFETIPSMLRVMLEALETMPAAERPQFESLRWLISNAEALPPELCRRWFELYPHIPMINTWGATECSDDVTHLHIEQPPDDALAYMPLGNRLINIRLYIVDAYLSPVPVGVAGELYIGGISVGRGYINDPQKTAASFLADPFGGDAASRFYRTGDIARYHRDGNIEFLGRLDHQVKIRGHRIEIGEVEAALSSLEGVRESVVVAAADARGVKRLVAYVVAEDGIESTPEALKHRMQQQLPPYMVPSVFIMLESLPLNSNGKIDRQRLPHPTDEDLRGGKASEPPRNQREELLAQIFAQVLGVERVGIRDDFFDLGGHSLLATQVISRVRRSFDLELPVRALFAAPTVAELAEKIEAAREPVPRLEPSALVPQPREARLPLSFAQQRLWFLDQFEPHSALYNQATAFRVSGALDVNALRESLRQVVRRHEALRTTFGVDEGEPFQIIHPEWNGDLQITDLSALPPAEREDESIKLAQAHASEPFDLTRGPLLRAGLLRLDEEQHLLLLNVHHIVSDGWSEAVLVREVVALYQAHVTGAPHHLPDLPIQYADFSIWQRQQLQGEALQTQLDYWRQQLEGVYPLNLPTDHARPNKDTFNGAVQSFVVPSQISSELKELSRSAGVTLYMTLLAAFQTLLGRYTGQDDIAVGSPIANRQLPELENLIGFFVNTLVLRSDLSSDPTFKELLRQVRKTTLDAYAHQDLPFERLVEEVQPERDMSRSPLFQVMFAFENFPKRTLELPLLRLDWLDLHNGTARFDMVLFMSEEAGEIHAALEYNNDLFDSSTITRFVAHLQNVLAEVVAAPETRLSRLRLLTETERHQILEQWNGAPGDYLLDTCAHRLFEATAAEMPDAIAAIFEDQSWTYGELDKRANQLARVLRARGVGADVLVGISIERSVEMVLAILGVLKAGGAYVPLDPDYPRERLSYILEQARIRVLLTQARLTSNLATEGVEVICLDRDWEMVCAESGDQLESRTEPANLAYVLYTSGSTGLPKGVAMPHRSVMNTLQWQIKDSILAPSERTLQFASINFDVSFQEIFSTWGAGGTLVLISEELRRDLPNLLRFISEKSVARLFLPFVALQQLMEEADSQNLRPSCLREIVTAGEQLHITQEMVRFFTAVAGCKFQNQYGPTENHATSFYTLEGPPSGWPALPPIGRPLDNVQVYIVDRWLNPVPVGVHGELLIGGAGVSRSYLSRPELTAERFIANPFSSRAGERLYKTGDLARHLPDGHIEFLGRLDHQVKIRGFRVELGEVEATLIQHPAVSKAVVVAQSTGVAGARLIAYVVCAPETEGITAELRSFLKERLPEYMIPAIFITLDALPLNNNGKVDRRRLPAPESSHRETQATFTAPRNAVEEVLAGIWASVLKVEKVGVHDNFFEMGGHSLLVVKVISRVRDAFQVELSVRQFFEALTVAELARTVIANEAFPGQVEKAASIIQKIQSMSPEAMKAMLEQKRMRKGNYEGN
jgi:amino acid adenylation domain-containing protein